jgi:SAM-dependent methyltransferase
MTDIDWWRDFFGEPWSRVQARGYAPERTSGECDLIEKALGLADAASVLDIPCGIGRHAIELARRGFKVTGVDFNPAYIATAKAAADAAGVSPEFVTCDMREFSVAEPFDAAFCYFGSFGYFSDEGNERFARAVSRSLRPGGRFLIEGHLCDTLLPIFRERDWFWLDPATKSARVLEERRWDMDSGRVESEWTIIDNEGIRSAAVSMMRIYFYRELRELLGRAGFASVAVLDGRSAEPFQMGARRAFVVAEKGPCE